MSDSPGQTMVIEVAMKDVIEALNGLQETVRLCTIEVQEIVLL